MKTGNRDNPISIWLPQLVARAGWQKACAEAPHELGH